jgi:hypothetical protein
MSYSYNQEEQSNRAHLTHRVKITDIIDKEIIGVFIGMDKRLHILDVPEGVFEIGENYNIIMYENQIEIRRVP